MLLAAVLCLLLLTGCGEKDVTVSVTLVNSGRDLVHQHHPSTSTEWDTEFVDGVRRQQRDRRQSRFSKGIRGPLPITFSSTTTKTTSVRHQCRRAGFHPIQDGDYIIFLAAQRRGAYRDRAMTMTRLITASKSIPAMSCRRATARSAWRTTQTCFPLGETANGGLSDANGKTTDRI